MKIIAKTEKGYLIEATKDEVANLMGERYGNDIKVGMNIHIHDMFEYLQDTKDNIGAIEECAQKLRNLADQIEAIPDPCKEIERLLNEPDPEYM